MRKNTISIKSTSEHKVEEIELLEIACMFFLKELNKIAEYNPIKCDIIIADSIVSEATGELLSGDMYRKPCGLFVCSVADYTNSIETIRTLAHELIHVWQYATGRLALIDNQWYWNKVNFGNSPYVGNNNDFLLPWEVEADSLDIVLAKNFYLSYLGS